MRRHARTRSTLAHRRSYGVTPRVTVRRANPSIRRRNLLALHVIVLLGMLRGNGSAVRSVDLWLRRGRLRRVLPRGRFLHLLAHRETLLGPDPDELDRETDGILIDLTLCGGPFWRH